MEVAQDLRYARTHEWARLEADGSVTVGITDHAQELLGDLVFVETPQVGRRFAQGQECGVVESVKAASDIYAPVSGEVIAVNEELAASPEKINQDAYAAWIFRITPADPGELSALMDAAAYAGMIDAGQG
ncbi:MAG: glycine cleavage system protein GcvH [Burkholderiales bacterium]|nr:glycine cleavage system protein GcvH [Burkholderiales bacterium]